MHLERAHYDLNSVLIGTCLSQLTEIPCAMAKNGKPLKIADIAFQSQDDEVERCVVASSTTTVTDPFGQEI